MFKSKRTVLIRRLWRSRGGGACPTGEQGPDSQGFDRDSEIDSEFKSAAHSLLKRLKDRQLELLLDAVESRGTTTTACVPLPKGEIRLGRGRTTLPHVLCCQLYRWPDLKHAAELKRLHFCCQSDRDLEDLSSGNVCCNPYHLSRLCQPESPPPPYSRFPVERSKTEAASLSQSRFTQASISTTGSTVDFGESTETGNTPSQRHQPYADADAQDSRGQPHWCHIAYWEHRSRVGRMYTVFLDSVNIFYELPHGDGFCLRSLHREERSESVIRTRRKVGCGLTLSREVDGVWMYNRSNFALFVNSPTLDALPPSRTLTVHKLLPGFSIKIFDFAKSQMLEHARREPEPPDGPVDPHSIRISFIKGWGPRYSRQFITSCPCWLEVILTRPR
ncbi:mothers against decapentaplegic homolog 6-like [Acanthaster planci]|uniref:Mothers against decapentaplegic homolog n=1 Tax=Acanthaster planci TaxID=133434 RepID=A0A8B7XVN9_ACAPL|nr:mothers against decapentaplegic homolog 6-like [Acanthaster planci]